MAAVPARDRFPAAAVRWRFPLWLCRRITPVRFSRMEALQTGTLFPRPDLPFKAAIQAKTQLKTPPRVELMALDFAIDELGLYLVTHSL